MKEEGDGEEGEGDGERASVGVEKGEWSGCKAGGDEEDDGRVEKEKEVRGGSRIRSDEGVEDREIKGERRRAEESKGRIRGG